MCGYNPKEDGKRFQPFLVYRFHLPKLSFTMAFRSLFVTCALFSVALAQSTELQLDGIKAHFKNAQLVPVPIPVFEPTAILAANFEGLGSITPGQLVTKERQYLQALFSIVRNQTILQKLQRCLSSH